MKHNTRRILVAVLCCSLMAASGCGQIDKEENMSQTEEVSTSASAESSSSTDMATPEYSETSTGNIDETNASTPAESSEAPSEKSDHSLEGQIDVFMANRSTWQISNDDSNGSDKYAVTDLDKDGLYEIIAITTGGSGYYTYTKIYEMNEDYSGINLVASTNPIEGIGIDWFDTSLNYCRLGDNVYAYELHDVWKSGWESSGETKAALIAHGSTFDISDLGTATYTYNDQRELLSSEYYDYDKNELTKDEYDNLFATALPIDNGVFGSITIEYTTELESSGYLSLSDEEFEGMLLKAASNTRYYEG